MASKAERRVKAQMELLIEELDDRGVYAENPREFKTLVGNLTRVVMKELPEFLTD